MGKFDGRVAIITGGGKGGGIGYGLSTAFAKEGCNLVITGRNTKKLDDAKEELERLYGVKVLACQADGGVEEQVAAVVKQAADTLGRIDFLINNAQNSASGVPLAEHTKEQFDQAIYSGLYAAFFYMKHCYPYLKETKGSVVNFASGAGLFGKPGQSSYAAAKEGIRGMTRVAATEWGPDGINCNLICPLVMTDALKKWREEYPAVYEQTIKGIPAGRFGEGHRPHRCVPVLRGCQVYLRRDHHHAGRQRPASLTHPNRGAPEIRRASASLSKKFFRQAAELFETFLKFQKVV